MDKVSSVVPFAGTESVVIMVGGGFCRRQNGADIFFLPESGDVRPIGGRLRESRGNGSGSQGHDPLGWGLYFRQRAVAGRIYPAAGGIGGGDFRRCLIASYVG